MRPLDQHIRRARSPRSRGDDGLLPAGGYCRLDLPSDLLSH